MKSILQEKTECYFCGKTYGLECHHIFNGNPMRAKSEQYGAKIHLCKQHHQMVTDEAEIRIALKRIAQQHMMSYYGWSLKDWRKNFCDKSYL